MAALAAFAPLGEYRIHNRVGTGGSVNRGATAGPIPGGKRVAGKSAADPVRAPGAPGPARFHPQLGEMTHRG